MTYSHRPRVHLHPMGALQRRPRGRNLVAWWLDEWWLADLLSRQEPRHAVATPCVESEPFSTQASTDEACPRVVDKAEERTAPRP